MGASQRGERRSRSGGESVWIEQTRQLTRTILIMESSIDTHVDLVLCFVCFSCGIILIPVEWCFIGNIETLRFTLSKNHMVNVVAQVTRIAHPIVLCKTLDFLLEIKRDF